jgi:hypothetical protein
MNTHTSTHKKNTGFMHTAQVVQQFCQKTLKTAGVCFLLTLILLFSATSVSAVTLPLQVYEASFVGSQLVRSTTPVVDATVTSVVCQDASCQSISRTIGTQQAQSSQVFVQLPNQLEQAGYGVYVTKPGYIPYELFADIAGTGTYPRQSVYLSKVDVCQATIDSFSVVNTAYPNQPVMVDINASLNAKAYSAIDSAGPLDYVPPSIAQQYTVQTTIILDILDNQSRVVHTQQTVISIPYSDSVPVQFSWTPTVGGKYTTRVSTLVTDSVCRSTLAQQTAKHISVINFGAKEYCYSLIQNLSISQPKPVEGSAIEVKAQAIANYYDEFGTLQDLSPNVIIELFKDSVGVGQWLLEKQNHPSGMDDVQTYTFSKKAIPLLESGNYLIRAKTDYSSCPFNNYSTDTADLSFVVSAKPKTNTSTTTPNATNTSTLPPNQAPYWTLPQYDSYSLRVGESLTFTHANYAFDANKDPLSFSVDTTYCIYASCDVYPTYTVFRAVSPGVQIIPFTVSDGKLNSTLSIVVDVLPQSNPPVLSDIADQTIFVGQTIQIPLQATDDTSTRLYYTFNYETVQTGYSCKLDSITQPSLTNILTCEGFASGSGSIRVIVSEQESETSLKDSDSFILTVIDPNQNTSAVLQVPDVYIDSLGLKQRLLNLSEYLQVYESGVPVSADVLATMPVSFSLTSQSNTAVALCFVNAISQTQTFFDCWARQGGYSDVTVRAVLRSGSVVADTFRVYVLNQSAPANEPSCGLASRTYSLAETQFVGSFCANGTLDQIPLFPQVGRSAIWTCSGVDQSNQPLQVSCVATRSTANNQVTPVCGSAARIYAVDETQFAGSFCANGTQLGSPAFPVQGGQSYWSCQGSNEFGQEVLQGCSATRSQIIVVVDPVCGLASKIYGSDEFAFTGAFCQVGTVSGTVPLFPAIERAVSWVCQNDGRQISCNAGRVSQVAISIVVPDFTITKNQELLIDLSQYTTQVPLGQGQYLIAQVPAPNQQALFTTTATNSIMTCTVTGSIARCQNAPNRIGTASFIAQVSYNGLVAQDAFTITVGQSYVNATANRQDKTSQRIYVSNIDVDAISVGGYMPITVFNDGTRSKDVKISARIVDLGFETSVGPFTVGAGQTVQRKVDFDTAVATPGVYDVRFVLSTQDGIERIVHRELVIE